MFKFVSGELLEQEVELSFNNSIFNLEIDD